MFLSEDVGIVRRGVRSAFDGGVLNPVGKVPTDGFRDTGAGSWMFLVVEPADVSKADEDVVAEGTCAWTGFKKGTSISVDDGGFHGDGGGNKGPIAPCIARTGVPDEAGHDDEPLSGAVGVAMFAGELLQPHDGGVFSPFILEYADVPTKKRDESLDGALGGIDDVDDAFQSALIGGGVLTLSDLLVVQFFLHVIEIFLCLLVQVPEAEEFGWDAIAKGLVLDEVYLKLHDGGGEVGEEDEKYLRKGWRDRRMVRNKRWREKGGTRAHLPSKALRLAVGHGILVRGFDETFELIPHYIHF